MSIHVLGISAFYHDSAAAIVKDGDIIAAAQEERFSRKKHDPRFPRHAINYCLEEAYIEPADIDCIVFYDNPLLTLDRILKSCMYAGSASRIQFQKAIRSVLGNKLWISDFVENTIGSLGKLGKLLFTEHHMAHAASAFFPSPFQSAAIITMDGVGEWATTSIGFGHENTIDLIEEINYPHSLGLLYSAFTYYCGFKVNSGEYKLMGLAPYGRPRYVNTIKDNLIDIKEDGSFRLNMDYFGFMDSLTMTNPRFHALFDGEPRVPETRITRKEMDLAASVQHVLEEVVIKLATFSRRETRQRQLVLAGGVALNCVANGKLLRSNLFDDLWIQPAAGDAGGALGAAQLVSHNYFDVPRTSFRNKGDAQKGSFLGVAYSSQEVRAFLDRNEYPYSHIANDTELFKIIARHLNHGMVVGYMRGRMEFGPRSLGARSILGDPRNSEMQSVMNLKIKYRESFRPFAPSVLSDDVEHYFDLDTESPYMLLVAPVRESRRFPQNADIDLDRSGDDMLKIISQPRSDIPAVTHVDYSARVQSVHQEHKADYYALISAFKEATGCAVVVNTSFNVRGEPIVCSPKDAYTCFMRTEMDVLVMEDCILYKEQQPDYNEEKDWKKTYELD